MTENNRKNNHSWHDRLSHAEVLRVLKRNVILQALLAIATIMLTIVLVFSLTVAWYTNVVQTGGLAFEAEMWNFDGHVELLGSQAITVAPGDEGAIPLRVVNDGDHIVAASATVDKKSMDEEMQKRLFFYVDTSMSRNGETVERVYISEKSSYTYTIFPHSTLELSETVKNGPLIKWTWVYDVLGYYVWGQQDALGEVTPADYIRPVEYAYDPAATTFDTAGNLVTVDGSKSVADFVEDLTAKDGYAGILDLTDPAVQAQISANGYYPISVNGNGYGVWLYLCSRDDIQKNMEYDNIVGSDATKNYTATVIITGQNSREDSRTVGSVEELQAALSDPTVGIIRLSENLELTRTLSLTGGSAIIDLNDKTLSMGEGVDKLVTLTTGAKLSIENGYIQGSAVTDNTIAINLSGAHLTMNDVVMTDVDTGVRIDDHTATPGNSSTVYVSGCTITADLYGVRIYGNQDESETRTKVVIRETTITGTDYAGILCNGTYGGIDTVISKSTVSGLYTSIYHPQKNSTLTIENGSVLSGYTGLVIKGGTVTVSDSTVHGTMEDPSDPDYSKSGWTDTGDGIYLEANYATEEMPVSITVINCTVTSDYAYAVRKYEANVEHATLMVRSGTYSGCAKADATEFNAVTAMTPYLASGSVATADDSEKVCTVTETPAS